MFPDNRWRYWDFDNSPSDTGTIDGQIVLRLYLSTRGPGGGSGSFDTLTTLDGGAVIATKQEEDFSSCIAGKPAAGDGAIAVDFLHSIRTEPGEPGARRRSWSFLSLATLDGPGDSVADYMIPEAYGGSIPNRRRATSSYVSAVVGGAYYARVWPDGRYERIDTASRGAEASDLSTIGGAWFASELGDRWYMVRPPAAGETRTRVFLREDGDSRATAGDIRGFAGDERQLAWWSAYPGGAVASEYRRHEFFVAPFTTDPAALRPRRVASMAVTERLPMLFGMYYAPGLILTGWGDGDRGGQAILIDTTSGAATAYEVPAPWSLNRMIAADDTTVTISVRREVSWEMRIWRLDRSLFTPYDRVIPAVP